MTSPPIALIQGFKKANALLNVTLQQIIHPEAALHVHYWGFMPQHFDNTEHKHSFFEACYVLDGTGSYIEGDTEHPLEAGALFLSRPGIPHQIRSRDGLALCYVAFELLSPPRERSGATAVKGPADVASGSGGSDAFRGALSRLAAEGICVLPGGSLAAQPAVMLWHSLLSWFQPGRSEAGVPPLLLQSTALSLLLALIQGHSPPKPQQASPPGPAEEGGMLMRQAELFIKDNLGEALSLERVAGYLHITPRHLTRSFRKFRQQSFVHYVQEQRVQRAKQLLLHTELQIKEISALCGFESVHYFTRIFTIKLGVSPARFRRSQFTEGRFDSRDRASAPFSPKAEDSNLPSSGNDSP
ncbi:helix-turn-helix domain-containing protein [Paenibacillus sp. JSM ZJ436]|uniref:helix-turn-helix domain-containing protein n=1 Tax=Paenibacillus sp. JSM ZJ436 TaxID=3376190 RepID=UPI0037BBFEF6